MMKQTMYAAAGLGALCVLSACGETKGDRAMSGAGIGAATGAAAGMITGGSGTTGALIGAGAGALGGALTDKEDVNLGKPVWR